MNNVAKYPTGLFTAQVKLKGAGKDEQYIGYADPMQLVAEPATLIFSERKFVQDAPGSNEFMEVVQDKPADVIVPPTGDAVPPKADAPSTSSAQGAAAIGTIPGGQSQGATTGQQPSPPTSPSGSAKTDASGSATPT